MKCPIDNVDLVMSERSGIEIDYCPTCRGVWLDRGELDKIIERGAAAPGLSGEAGRRDEPRYAEAPRHDERHDDRGHKRPYKKRESFLGELFDF
jgi:hypothetical protein